MLQPVNRNRYHSTIVWCFHQRKEYLLSEEVRKSIPASTISTWRNNQQAFFGADFIPEFQQAVKHYELMAEHKQLKKVIFTISRVWITLFRAVEPVLKKTDEWKKDIVNHIQHLQQVLSLSTACQLFGISKQAFYSRIGQIKYACRASPFQLCIKKHPAQLTPSEVNCIKDAFCNPEFNAWPAVSIYYFLLRSKQLNIGLSTFYKYVKILGLKRKWGKETINTQGIQSSRPNAFLHVDTTYKKLPDGTKVAVVFVSDNFSRAILGFHLATENGATNVLSALKMAIQTIAVEHPAYLLPATLVADGGKENHAQSITELLSICKNPPISKVIARKDIQYSNSPVEAVNKIFKRYLRKLKPQDLKELEQLLPKIIEDYNKKRPHGALKGLTPWESYTQIDPVFDFTTQIQQAKANRLEQNRKMSCKDQC